MPTKKTVREIIVATMKRGATNAEVLEKVVKAHPYSKLGVASINHYRNRLREEGFKIPSDRDLQKGRKAR